jgi:hypothetical protein
MKTQISISKSIAIAMTLTALLAAISVQAVPQTEKTLYERLGGVFAIAAVVCGGLRLVLKAKLQSRLTFTETLNDVNTTNLNEKWL